jgi:hypothetical protein
MDIVLKGATQDVLDDIIEKIGSLAIKDVFMNPDTDLCTIMLDPQMIKIAYDSEALHILRFELTETRHCIIDNFRFRRLVIS